MRAGRDDAHDAAEAARGASAGLIRAQVAGESRLSHPPPHANPDAPCQACGACCASYRVDFSVHELDEYGGRVPSGLAVELSGTLCRLRGTDHLPPRCVALTGRIGGRVACGIYEWRPGPCRELEAGGDACQRARSRHGLAPLADF